MQLRKLSNKVIHSTMKLLPAWHNILEEQHLPVINIPQDVATRWNLTFDMLEYVSIHQAAVDAMTQYRDLQDFELMDYEWKIVGQLRDVLKVYTTMFFSRSTPNLATVIPAMDLIDEKLTTYSLDDKYLPTICAAMGLAKKTLNRYYQSTEHSDVYCIAMILHPCHKLTYFKLAKW
ncbi:hypothetical protein P692DRAFT_201716457 [Suillus brevipes Sb2]|nr:hypothetical protein P692DRAFT_201716457 [Suillus brevipes Sb2]